MTPPRICYFGAYDPEYPRNLILRRGLEMHGAHVVECRVTHKQSTRQRARQLAEQFRSDQCDVILLAEFNQSLAPTAWRLARKHKKRLVVDFFTSTYDSAVSDRGTTRPLSPSALRYWLIDWLAFRLADRVITDTQQHADYYARTFGANPQKMSVIPVGASQEWFLSSPPRVLEERLLVLFYGTFIPLHGIDTILHAAHLLRNESQLRFEIIGNGQLRPAMKMLAQELNLTNLTFVDPLAAFDLPSRINCADIALGIFGTTDKAQRVIPNKVFQTLALGKPLITADTPALSEGFTPNQQLITTPSGDSSALAEAIQLLAGDANRRTALGQAGRDHMEANFTESALGKRLLEVLA